MFRSRGNAHGCDGCVSMKKLQQRRECVTYSDMVWKFSNHKSTPLSSRVSVVFFFVCCFLEKKKKNDVDDVDHDYDDDESHKFNLPSSFLHCFQTSSQYLNNVFIYLFSLFMLLISFNKTFTHNLLLPVLCFFKITGPQTFHFEALLIVLE